MFKNAGALVVDQQGRAGSVLVFVDAPDEMLRSRVYLSAVAAGIEGGIEATGSQGHCALADVDEQTKTARFRVSWKPDRRAGM